MTVNGARVSLFLGIVACGAFAGVVATAQPDAPAPLHIEKVKDNLFVITGGRGTGSSSSTVSGNTTVFIAASGVVLVDTKLPGFGAGILEQVRSVTAKPITMIINTHTHADHTGGNPELPRNVEHIAHQNTRANMAKMDLFKAANESLLPAKTFTDRLSLLSGADRIDLYYFGPGHTNGDAIVVFPALRTAHLGDLFAGKGLPLVDGANGGSVLHYPETLNKVHGGVKNVDTIINGHMPAQTTWADLKEYADFNKDLVAWMQAELKAGKTPEQAAAEWKVPEKYKGYSATISTLMGGMVGRIQTLQKEMK